MSETKTIYEKAITTERPAEMLAKKHGFEDLRILAESLPEGAHVLDVGAGASPFGKEVAALRPDITWTNFDYSYQDPAILEEVTKDAPNNVQHIAGDATKLAEVYGAGTFDTVFSYWLLPHLSIDNDAPAKQAARAIFEVAKDGALISVGPKTNLSRKERKETRSFQVIKSEEMSADVFADAAVSATKLSGRSLRIQRLQNQYATQFFGTSRYTKGRGRHMDILNPKTGKYVPAESLQGVSIAFRLTASGLRQAQRQRKQNKRS